MNVSKYVYNTWEMIGNPEQKRNCTWKNMGVLTREEVFQRDPEWKGKEKTERMAFCLKWTLREQNNNESKYSFLSEGTDELSVFALDKCLWPSIRGDLYDFWYFLNCSFPCICLIISQKCILLLSKVFHHFYHIWWLLFKDSRIVRWSRDSEHLLLL